MCCEVKVHANFSISQYFRRLTPYEKFSSSSCNCKFTTVTKFYFLLSMLWEKAQYTNKAQHLLTNTRKLHFSVFILKPILCRSCTRPQSYKLAKYERISDTPKLITVNKRWFSNLTNQHFYVNHTGSILYVKSSVRNKTGYVQPQKRKGSNHSRD